VASVDPGTEVARVVERAGAGVVVPPGDAGALTDALRSLVADPAVRAEMGAAGRRFVEQWPSPADVAAAYEALFEELVTGRG
jgi:colanic acid biosynthesis glycosyl transferase WcaI